MYPNTNNEILFQNIDNDANYLYINSMYFNNESSGFHRPNPSPHTPAPMQSPLPYERRTSSSVDIMTWPGSGGYRSADAMGTAGPPYHRTYSAVRDPSEFRSSWDHSTTVSPPQWPSMPDHDSYWDPTLSTSLPEPEETKPNIHALRVQSRSPSVITSGLATPPIAGPSTTASRDGTPKKSCSHCHATTTPLWRREPGTQRPLCNACGLYLQQRHKLRPQELIDADADDGEEEAPPVPGSPECSHCHTRVTSVWRRSKTGAQLCNACGVYVRLKHRDRPLSLKKNKIKPRSKHPK